MADEDAAMEGASGGTTPGTAAPPPVPVPVARPTTLTSSRDLVLVDCAVEGRVLRCSNGHVYKVIKTLRECIYGKVRVATVCRLFNDGLYHETQELVALKIMSKDRIRRRRARDGSQLSENPTDELRAMQFLSVPGCPHILNLIEIIHNAEYLIAVLEYAPQGELFDIVTQSPTGRFTEEVAKYYFTQLMTGTAYMHDLGVAHSDLSLENMLVAAKNVGKIIDFGLCIDMPRNPDGKFAPIGPRGPVGKLFYMAPEVYIGTKPYWGHLADVWSCGVMLFIMLTGVPVFKYPSRALDERFTVVADGGLLRLLAGWGMNTWFSAQAQDLMFRILREDPLQRPTAREVLAHPWLGGPGMPTPLNNQAALKREAAPAVAPGMNLAGTAGAASAGAAPAGAGAGAGAGSGAGSGAGAGAGESSDDGDTDMGGDDGNPTA